MKNKPKDGKAVQKKIRHVQVAVAHIYASFNNVIITVTDQAGNALFSISSGAFFSGAKKATPHAAQVIAEKAREWLRGASVKALSLVLKGPHNSRDSAIKVFANTSEDGYVVTSITDVTPVAHNGCRARKQRRM